MPVCLSPRVHIHLDLRVNTSNGMIWQIPGPTIVMEACQTYELTYTNNLEGPNPGGDWNHMKDPNTTNIHTHGLHISGESPADDVLFVELTPGESHTCESAIQD